MLIETVHLLAQYSLSVDRLNMAQVVVEWIVTLRDSVRVSLRSLSVITDSTKSESLKLDSAFIRWVLLVMAKPVDAKINRPSNTIVYSITTKLISLHNLHTICVS